MSIEDRGRVYVELLIVMIVFFVAMDRITPWEVRSAAVMNAIEQRQVEFGEGSLLAATTDEADLGTEEVRPEPFRSDSTFFSADQNRYAEAD